MIGGRILKKFNDLKIGTKMTLLAICTFIALTFIQAVSFYYFNDSNNKIQDMYERRLMPVKEINEVRTNFRTVYALYLEILGDKDLTPQDVSDKTEEIKRLSDITDKLLQEYTKLARTDYEKEQLSLFNNALKGYRDVRQQAFTIAQKGQQLEGYRYFRNNAEAYMAIIDKSLGKLAEYNTKRSQELMELARSDFKKALLISIVIFLIILAISLGFIVKISRSITKPAGIIVDRIQKISGGDLTHIDRSVISEDEMGYIAAEVINMRNSLRNLVQKVDKSVGSVAAASQQLMASSEQSAQAAAQVAQSITEVAGGVQRQTAAVDSAYLKVANITDSIQEAANKTNVLTEKSQKMAVSSETGNKSVEKAVEQMKNIRDSVNNTATFIQKLGERSNEIGQIVETISGIAGQTNLLALNAAIEAARAGDQGRGFAVVAEEVRKLAEQSESAAKQIAALISTIQSDTNVAVAAMKEGTVQVENGSVVVNEAGRAFIDIKELVMNVTGQIAELEKIISSIQTSSGEVLHAVKEIDNISKETNGQTQTVSAATEEQSAAMQEIASSSQSLSQLADELRVTIEQFKL